jgi:hypothetical protein
MLNCFFYNRIVTGLQLAQAAVFSFPLFPDVSRCERFGCLGAAAAAPFRGLASAGLT